MQHCMLRTLMQMRYTIMERLGRDLFFAQKFALNPKP